AGLGFAASPLFIVHSGLFLSYLWTTALLTAGTAAGFNALRTRRAWMFAVVGALFGVAQLTRPFDALLVAVPVAAYMAVRLLREGRATFLRDLAFAAMGIAPFLLITLVYNAHVTGSPLRFPLQASDPRDTFGFGQRGLGIGVAPVHYTSA